MKKECRRKVIESDMMLKPYQKQALLNNICSTCTDFNCKHNNYFVFLRAVSRQNSRSTLALEVVKKMLEVGENKGSL